MKPEKVYLTPYEVAELLQISLTNTYELLRSGQISSIRIGRQYRIPFSAIEALGRRAAN